MCTSLNSSNPTKHAFLHLFLIALVVLIGFQKGFALEGTPNPSGSKLFILVDCDDDNDLATKPYGDKFYMIDPRDGHEKIVQRNLKVTDECGGFSVSEDGHYFVICDQKLTFYEMRTGREVWSLMGAFRSATFSNDLIFAKSLDSLYMIDLTGLIVKHARMGMFDFAVDRSRNAFWMTGLQIEKYDLDLKPVLTVDGIKAMNGPFWIELNPDGSLWLSHRDAFKKYGNENGLVRISSDGAIMQTVKLNFSPQCARVNPLDGNVWVTGGYRDFSKIGEEFPDTFDELNELTGTEYCTQKYDSKGDLLFHLHEGGNSLVVDPIDGSIWMITNERSVAHFSSIGEKLKELPHIPDGRKWLAIVPIR